MASDKYVEILTKLSTIEKEDREKIKELFEYFDIEFDNIVWNHNDMDIVRVFRHVKKYLDSAKNTFVNCEVYLEKYKKHKQSDKQEPKTSAEQKKKSLATMRGYDIQGVIDSVPKGGTNG